MKLFFINILFRVFLFSFFFVLYLIFKFDFLKQNILIFKIKPYYFFLS